METKPSGAPRRRAGSREHRPTSPNSLRERAAQTAATPPARASRPRCLSPHSERRALNEREAAPLCWYEVRARRSAGERGRTTASTFFVAEPLADADAWSARRRRWSTLSSSQESLARFAQGAKSAKMASSEWGTAFQKDTLASLRLCVTQIGTAHRSVIATPRRFNACRLRSAGSDLRASAPLRANAVSVERRMPMVAAACARSKSGWPAEAQRTAQQRVWRGANAILGSRPIRGLVRI